MTGGGYDDPVLSRPFGIGSIGRVRLSLKNGYMLPLRYYEHNGYGEVKDDDSDNDEDDDEGEDQGQTVKLKGRRVDANGVTLPSTVHTLILDRGSSFLRWGKDGKAKVRSVYINFSTLNIPPSLRTLILDGEQPLDGLRLPDSCSSIVCWEDFDQRLDRLPSLPSSLRTLDMTAANYDKYDYSIVDVLGERVLTHPTLTKLHLPKRISTGPLTQLPPNLRRLAFEHLVGWKESASALAHLSQSSSWPSTLTGLFLSTEINLPLTQLNLPPSVTELNVHCHPEQTELDGLPPRLRWLTLPGRFDGRIHSHQLPASLTYLNIRASVKHALSDIIWPAGLRTLILGGGYEAPDGEHLPHIMTHPNLTHLSLCIHFDNAITVLPPKLRRLQLFGCNGGDDDPCQVSALSPQVEWPQTLLSLLLPMCWNKPVDQLNLPDSLTELRFGESFNRFHPPVASLRLPPRLRYLQFGWNFNPSDFHRLKLPSTLTSLTIERGSFIASEMKFNQARFPQLPDGLRILHLGTCFNQPISHMRLPDTIERLSLGPEFEHELDGFHFPASLTSFTFPPQYDYPVDELDFSHCHQLDTIDFDAGPFNHPIDGMKLPRSLTNLDLENAYSFNQSISKLQLPPYLRFLSLPPSYRQPTSDLQLPASLRQLSYYVQCQPCDRIKTDSSTSSSSSRGSSGSSSSSTSHPSASPSSCPASAFASGPDPDPDPVAEQKIAYVDLDGRRDMWGRRVKVAREVKIVLDPFHGRRFPPSMHVYRMTWYDNTRRY